MGLGPEVRLCPSSESGGMPYVEMHPTGSHSVAAVAGFVGAVLRAGEQFVGRGHRPDAPASLPGFSRAHHLSKFPARPR